MPALTTPVVALHDLRGLAGTVAATTDVPWLRQWADTIARRGDTRTHLAVMTGPYLQRLIDGVKTVESRFSKHRTAPFQRVAPGDVIFFKPSGAAVRAAAMAGSVHYFDLQSTPINQIRDRFGEAIAPEDERFWSMRAHSRYVTLVEIEEATVVPDIVVTKRDRRGWVVLNGDAGAYDPRA